jgi:hypothetical protein
VSVADFKRIKAGQHFGEAHPAPAVRPAGSFPETAARKSSETQKIAVLKIQS